VRPRCPVTNALDGVKESKENHWMIERENWEMTVLTIEDEKRIEGI